MVELGSNEATFHCTMLWLSCLSKNYLWPRGTFGWCQVIHLIIEYSVLRGTWSRFSFILNTKTSPDSIKRKYYYMCLFFFKKTFYCYQRRNTVIQSYWDKVYSRSSFNQIWILKYWISWIILIIVLFQNFLLFKHATFLHFQTIHRGNV